MSIAIVSAPPKSAPPQAAENAASAGSAASALDFASLLLGHLSAVRLGAADEGSVEADADEDAAESGDALDLLAALTQAPLERRDPAPDEDAAAPGLSAPVDEKLSTGKALTLAGMASDETLPGAASGPAAKFAGLAGENATATAVAANLTASLHARPDEPRPIPVTTPLYDRAWSDDFAQKVSWLATHNGQSAELTLNPPAMGSIEISLRIDNDKSAATATFVSASAEVRETIETALPRLREMLAGVGIALGQTQVSAESFRQAPGKDRNPGQGVSPARNELSILADQEVRTGASIVGAGRGLVDMFV
jgi:flagellar hook-length control protein FliK